MRRGCRPGTRERFPATLRKLSNGAGTPPKDIQEMRRGHRNAALKDKTLESASHPLPAPTRGGRLKLRCRFSSFASQRRVLRNRRDLESELLECFFVNFTRVEPSVVRFRPFWLIRRVSRWLTLPLKNL